MSLVEQTARKLEQLRKSGEQIGGDLAYPQESEQAERPAEKASTIERIARELEQRQRPSQPQTSAGQTAAASTASPVRAESADAYVDKNRREPVLLQAAPAPAPSAIPEAGDLPLRPAPRPAQSRTVEIDMSRLTAAGLLTPDTPQSRLANELRVIKRPLINNCLGKSAGRIRNANRIMITSALPGEGKSFLSTNLARSIATERDSTVLRVEADPTRPSLAALLGIPQARGLMDLLVDPSLDVADVLVKTNVGRLSFIPAGQRQEHATELLASGIMEKLVEHLATRYADRILIFDSGPLLAAPEAHVLARYMGQVVLVVEAGKTTHSAVQQALATIEQCPIVMLALNKAFANEEQGYYYYG